MNSSKEISDSAMTDREEWSVGGIHMIDSISANIGSTAKMATPIASPSQMQAPAALPTGNANAGDSVEISVSAQIKSMKDQGQTITEIAMQMGLDSKTVASYLPGEYQA